ncbi:hypothetical protein [Natrialbaceae archaeon AArc-T1-2]|uniref:hypothetical protein n=1 Tax=Natrialbaceae archaeon AArc-T1-2 TaxID=3053904 RepID=UPI00255AC779|nr:hypothetical protein [Natrialbaceae archaeon AArc-T1-2]WIV66036.1 hypothetical protein QQ977_10045 [Natrialbaceae archaeon AArc-T1-2]
MDSFTELVFLTFYVSFFVGTITILVLAHRRMARELWLGAFFAALIAVTIVGTPLLPVVDMHKFAQPSEEERVYYEPRVVDDAGNELYYDYRAIPPTTASRSSTVLDRTVHEYNETERLEIGEFYLFNANEYRAEVESGDRSIAERFQPPRYVDDEQWTAEELEGHGEFVTIRIYERTITHTDDTSEIESNEEELVLTIDLANETITEAENA